mgnify:FL=1
MYLKKGDIAPNFKLINYDNKTFTLSNFKGSKILLWFFPKANTPGWILEGIGFRDEFKKYQKKHITIIGVSADDVTKQKKFVEKFNFPYLMFSDVSKNMLKDYKAWGLKKFMGREYEGIHRISYLIDEKGIIDTVFDKVKAKSHANDILNSFENSL